MFGRVIRVVALLLVGTSWAQAKGEEPRVTLLATVGLMDRTASVRPAPSWVPSRPLYGNTTYRDVLLPLMKSSDARERARAAFVVGLVGDQSSAESLASMLKDRDRNVRVFAGLALGFLGDERGIHVCDAVLRADLDWIRYYAIYSLWSMDSSRARAVIDRHRDGQSKFIAETLRAALRIRHANSPTSPMVSEKGPEPGDLWAELCDAFIMEADKWWHNGDFDQTIRCHEAAMLVDPTYTDGYSLIAWLQWSMGDDAAAIKTLDRGTRDLPDSPDTWGALGQHYWMTKRYTLALEPLRKSIELGGDHLIRRPYAYCLEKQGKIEECLAQWNEIARECPEDPATKPNIERLRKILAEQDAGR